MITAIVVSTTGWMLLWSATLVPQYMHDHFILLVIYVFIAGQSRPYGFVTSLLVSMQQVAPARRPFIVVIAAAAFDFGTFLFVLIYELMKLIFINGHVDDAENQNLSGFFLTMAIVVCIGNVFGTVIIRTCNRKWEDSLEYTSFHDVTNESTKTDTLRRNVENDLTSTHNMTANDNITETSKLVDKDKSTGLWISYCIPTCTGSVLLSLDFHLILWSTAIAMSVCIFTGMNLTYITKALSFSDYDFWIVSSYRAVVFVGRICLGLPMALCQSINTMAELVLVVTLILVVSGQILQLTCGQMVATIFISEILTAIAHGSAYILGPFLMHRYFGMDHYGRNIGIVYSMAPIITLFVGLFFGMSYDNQIDSKDSHYCYGMGCLRAGLTANIVISTIALLLSCVLVFRKCRK